MSPWEIEMKAKEQGFTLFDKYDGLFVFRRFVPGFGNSPLKDDRREWLRCDGNVWVGYAIHTDADGDDWYESDTFEGSVAEISAKLVAERAEARFVIESSNDLE